ncbi:MAG: VacJ family lipoprotein, partial [Candidatus Thioglobus sp.]
LDKNVLLPVAKIYKDNMPKKVQNRVRNFSANVSDFSTLGNELAQFEVLNSGNTLSRVLINSTVGLFGLFDVASGIGLHKSKEDFGQTLAVWGVPEGNYMVLPVLGSSSVRGIIGAAADGAQKTKLTKKVESTPKVAVEVIKSIDTRVQLLSITKLLKKSNDPYIAVRSSYLQKKKYDVYNGNLPEDDEF